MKYDIQFVLLTKTHAMKRVNIISDFRSSIQFNPKLVRGKENLPTMKFFLLFVACFFFTAHEILAKPSPQPKPDNDVHFHVNMPGSGRSFPLKD